MTYTDEALEAYGKAYAILARAYERAKVKITPYQYDKAQEMPALGFTDLYLKAIRSHILTQADQELISIYLDEVPGDFETTSERISTEQQGIWVLAAWGKRIHTLTHAEAAEQLGVSAPMITKLIKSGKLDAVKVDKHWLISQHSVTMYKDGRR